MSPTLLAPPPSLPQPRRDSNGQMTGREALASLTALYDIAGQIRAALVELQAELRLTQDPAHAQSR